MCPAILLALLAADPAAEEVTPADAARIKYTTQRFVYLDVGESSSFKLRNGTERRIRLVSVKEHADSVIELLRRAEVAVEIDGKPLDLICEPCRMPSERDGIRIQADTTSGWVGIPKRVQLSIWDATDPIVDTGRFTFPLSGYRLLSQGTQGYNEPVHLGDRDGDPEGQRFYHNYGFDLAGFEGKDKVVSCIDGTVAAAIRDQGTLAVEDDRGIVIEFGHLDTILPEIQAGAKVSRGQAVGILGRKGASGNFSHLHVGLSLSVHHFRSDRPCRALNLYPWLVEAYRHAAGTKLLAVARPHVAARVGEVVRFDGTRSLAFDSPVTAYRWEFPGGVSLAGARVERAFDAPGTYQVALWIEDGRSLRDVDFATVRVFSKEKPEGIMPTLFLTHTPTSGVRTGQPVSFRLWPQGREDVGAIRIDFGDGGGDGGIVERYEPYSSVNHAFKTAGIHVVTATASAGGLPLTQKVKVVVE
jgi:hypothetical protein